MADQPPNTKPPRQPHKTLFVMRPIGHKELLQILGGYIYICKYNGIHYVSYVLKLVYINLDT